MIILKIGLILGMIGHAINMWCDRVLSITPIGTLHVSAIITFIGWMFLI